LSDSLSFLSCFLRSEAFVVRRLFLERTALLLSSFPRLLFFGTKFLAQSPNVPLFSTYLQFVSFLSFFLFLSPVIGLVLTYLPHTSTPKLGDGHFLPSAGGYVFIFRRHLFQPFFSPKNA